jgi:class 3 adenylate cyclase
MPTTLREVLDTWESFGRQRGAVEPGTAAALATAALDLGHPTLACEILREPVARNEADVEVRWLAALAHARIGAYAQAGTLIDSLLADPAAAARAVDVRSLAGRIAKDRWARLPAGAERDHAGAQALAHYREAWQATRDPFPGINAASLLLLTGDARGSRDLAIDVQQAARNAATLAAHWREATLGEAALLLGEIDAAASHYANAVTAAGNQVGHVASMRRQLRLLREAIDIPAAVSAAVQVPAVVVFTGHMIDAPGTQPARFPASIEMPLAQRIAERLELLGAGFGYCSAACGADLLFIEAMLARGAEVHITLPFDRGDFIATSVAFAGEAWVDRFEAALQRATSVTFGVRERFLGDDALFAYAASLVHGAAVLRAQQLEAEPIMLAAIDRDAGGGIGGTRDTLQSWTRHGLRADYIELADLSAAAAPPAARAEHAWMPPIELRSAPLRREIKTMLFADMVGFSKLREEDTPSFLLNFIGAIADIVHRSPQRPVFVNTWGDGLFLVFDDVDAGADFALLLRDSVLRTDWPARGLPAGTSIRIGMHTGPVFPADDPILGRPNFFGSHVIRAARIEPVAAPGAVYVSTEMASVLAADGGQRFATDYLGRLPLAKGFGTDPLYRLRRAGEAE